MQPPVEFSTAPTIQRSALANGGVVHRRRRLRHPARDRARSSPGSPWSCTRRRPSLLTIRTVTAVDPGTPRTTSRCAPVAPAAGRDVITLLPAKLNSSERLIRGVGLRPGDDQDGVHHLRDRDGHARRRTRRRRRRPRCPARCPYPRPPPLPAPPPPRPALAAPPPPPWPRPRRHRPARPGRQPTRRRSPRWRRPSRSSTVPPVRRPPVPRRRRRVPAGRPPCPGVELPPAPPAVPSRRRPPEAPAAPEMPPSPSRSTSRRDAADPSHR